MSALQGSPGRLWRRWILLAAAEAGSADTGLVTRLVDRQRFTMRMLAGDRLVLSGPSAEPAAHELLADIAPDWALSDAELDAPLLPGFLAWQQRGEWSGVPHSWGSAAAPAFGDIASDQVTVAALQRLFPNSPPQAAAHVLDHPDLDSLTSLVGAARARAAVEFYATAVGGGAGQLSVAARQHLLDVVRAQMRQATELGDRGLPRRPSLLRQWAQVNLGEQPLRFGVHAHDRGFLVSATHQWLPEPKQRSLLNVLAELRESDAADHGRWLFARVSSQGRAISLERAFDHWPAWFTPPDGVRVPSLGSLRAEMLRRTPPWRPAWAALIS